MGCGTSRLQAEERASEGIGDYKIFHRKRINHAIIDSTIFLKRTPLALEGSKDKDIGENDFLAKRGRKSISSSTRYNNINIFSKKPKDKSDEEVEEEDKDKKENENKEKSDDYRPNIDEDGKYDYHREDDILYPASPSFREYCLDSDSSDGHIERKICSTS